MKKFTLMILATMLGCMPISANRIVELRGDTLVVAEDNDTVRLTASQITNKLGGLLDDTVINLTDEDEVARVNEEMDRIEASRRSDWRVDMQRIWSDTAENISIALIWGLVTLIVFILLFSYLKRRRKYKMVEKAIENNYPLPPYVFDAHLPAQPTWQNQNAYRPVQGTPVTEGSSAEPIVDENGEVVPPPINNNPESDPWSNQAQAQPAMGTPRMNWRAFQNSFILVAVGLGLMIMFHETALVGIFSILVLIGLGKGFIEYQDQRDAINAWRNK